MAAIKITVEGSWDQRQQGDISKALIDQLTSFGQTITSLSFDGQIKATVGLYAEDPDFENYIPLAQQIHEAVRSIGGRVVDLEWRAN